MQCLFKHSLASQVKELRSRVADMEGQTRPSTGISVLENKIQELEERLRSEERYDTWKVQKETIMWSSTFWDGVWLVKKSHCWHISSFREQCSNHSNILKHNIPNKNVKLKYCVLCIALIFCTQREDQHPGLPETNGEETEGAERHTGCREKPAYWAARSGES